MNRALRRTAGLCVGFAVGYKGLQTDYVNRRVILPTLQKLPPETAHSIAIYGLRWRLAPKDTKSDDDILQTELFGNKVSNPIGLAGGFDKNGEAIAGCFDLGFGFTEIGTITPYPQKGNAKPRMFRLEEDECLINRCGFNSKGLDVALNNLDSFKSLCGRDSNSNFKLVGINIGKNKSSNDFDNNLILDYITSIRWLDNIYPNSYIVLNISSPNTHNLRNLQHATNLNKLLTYTNSCKSKLPIVIKIAPDLTNTQLEAIADLCLRHKVDGIIVGNTTIQRPITLKSLKAEEIGGLSGKALKDVSTDVLRKMYQYTNGEITLIGTGGVSSGQDAYDKIRNGATAVQLYTALTYQGGGVVRKVKDELTELLKRDGYANVSEAVGADVPEVNKN